MAVAVVLLAVLAGPSARAGKPQEVAGVARITDGDTIRIGDQRVRLYGIDAPERAQVCQREGRPWRCGADATAALKRIVGDREVRCRTEDRDRYGRLVAICSVQPGGDIAGELVRQGYALAYTRYSDRYVGQEAEARAAGRALWAGDFTAPWEWRSSKRR